MRIISQDKRKNVPYEESTIVRHKAEIYAYGNGFGEIKLGSYSTEERAEEVFKKIIIKGQIYDMVNNFYGMPEE